MLVGGGVGVALVNGRMCARVCMCVVCCVCSCHLLTLLVGASGCRTPQKRSRSSAHWYVAIHPSIHPTRTHITRVCVCVCVQLDSYDELKRIHEEKKGKKAKKTSTKDEL